MSGSASSIHSSELAPSGLQVWKALHKNACAPYAQHGRFAWHFARGKLGRDPVFRAMLERGFLLPRKPGDTLRVVDIGCGQGLLASLLHQVLKAQQVRNVEQKDHTGRADRAPGWPSAWPRLPATFSYHGIELMSKDVERARQSLRGIGPLVEFVCGDMRSQPLPACDLVVILDVLHYVNHVQQESVLRAVALALQPHGRLLLRIGNMAQARGFAASQWVDRIVTFIRGHRTVPQWGRALQEWIAVLESQGFEVRAEPMSQGTPFANVLLIADLKSDLPGTAA